MFKISMVGGGEAQVDEADLSLSRHRWHRHPGGYASRKEGKRTVLMHRELLSAPAGLEVDHINGDKLDNRRANLRLATIGQNRQNAARRKDNTSGVKGVSWKRGENKWRARIVVDGKERHLGLFDRLEDAERAVRTGREALHGAFTCHGVHDAQD